MNNIAQLRKVEAQKAFDEINQYTKENLCLALDWAKHELYRHHGYAGWEFNLFAKDDKMMFCFSQLTWSGDHCGSGMDTASEAIVMAVCEYFAGC